LLWKDENAAIALINQINASDLRTLGFIGVLSGLNDLVANAGDYDVGDKEDKLEVAGHADGLGYFKTRTALPVVFVTDQTLARYKLAATPTTLLIDSAGKVEHAWVGKRDNAKLAEVAAAVEINLGSRN
jgi:hypothetical protein